MKLQTQLFNSTANANQHHTDSHKWRKLMRIGLHILFWIGWWVFYFLLISGEQFITLSRVSNEETNTALSIFPENATASNEITLNFDPSKACYKDNTLEGVDTIYMHSAAFTLDDIENWGTKNWGSYILGFNEQPFDGIHPMPVLTDPDKDGIFSITLTPYDFYNVPKNLSVIGMAVVFNGGDWSTVAKRTSREGCEDFFIPLNDKYNAFKKNQMRRYWFIAQITLFIILCAALVSYFAVYVLFPRFLFEKKYLAMAVFSILTIAASLLAESTYLFSVLGHTPATVTGMIPTLFDFYFLFTGTYFTVFFFITIKLIKYWYQKQYSFQQLAKDKIEAELILLKSQLNPHFLFNSLNSIYGLALKKSELTPKIILQLSELLDYLLYKSNQKIVALDQELKLITDYLELEKLRYTNRLQLDYKVEGATSDLMIPPVLLLPFVENSFKHGVSKMRKNVWIKVKVLIKGDMLFFEIENSKKDIEGNNGSRPGIGLKNVKTRLDLIYQQRYNLIVEDKGDRFYVSLQIPLKGGLNEN